MSEWPPYDAFLLLSFGGPEGPDDVMPFLERVTGGRVPASRLATVAEHYHHFGGRSPINDQNRALLAAVQAELVGAGLDLRCYWANRNWHPLLADTLLRMRDDGVRRALCFVTSAYASHSGCRQYLDAIVTARAELGEGAPGVEKLRAFFDHPGFVGPLAARLGRALAQVGPEAPIAFTAHSVPAAWAETSDYVRQLRATAGLVAARADPAASHPWDLVFQSRSGPPSQEWLEPDIGAHLSVLAAAGAAEVVVDPIGFVSDHLEVVWDLDTEAAAHADRLGVRMVRADTVGTDPAFVAMVRELVQERISGAPARALSPLGPHHTHCPAGCCPR